MGFWQRTMVNYMSERAPFWSKQRVVVTGHSGFKGYWLATWLRKWGSDVLGLSLRDSPPVSLRNFSDDFPREVWADIRGSTWTNDVRAFEPTIVFHLAAQPLVSVGYTNPLETVTTNVCGTANLLQCVSDVASVRAVVVVTTDKVYSPTAHQPYSETSALGGHDPYAASKAAAEMIVAAWPSRSARIVSARSGNVIGGGDFAAHRLVPDMVRAWSANRAVELRNPTATRPWQHVLEPLDGYLRYAEVLAKRPQALPSALNFGPSQLQSVSVSEFVNFAVEAWHRIFGGASAPAVKINPGDYVEAEHLSLDSTAAQRSLDWANKLDWRDAVEWTFAWHRHQQDGAAVNELIISQIDDYLRLTGGPVIDHK